MDKQFITVINNNGVEVNAEILNAFKIEEFNKKYAVYTINETNDNGMIKIYVAELIENNGNYDLRGIANDDEWNRVKDILKQMARGGE